MVGTGKPEVRAFAPVVIRADLRRGVIACPVCSHMAHSERTDRGLRVVCPQCAAAYSVPTR